MSTNLIPDTVTRLTVVVRDANQTRQFHLDDGATLMVGSGSNCGIQLNDPQLSSIHCVLRFGEGRIVVQDWCSATGTFANDAKIDGEQTLDVTTQLRIGRFQLEFVAESSATASIAARGATTVANEPTSAEGPIVGNRGGDEPDAADHVVPVVATESGGPDVALAADDVAADAIIENEPAVDVPPSVDVAACEPAPPRCPPTSPARNAPASLTSLPPAEVDPETVALLQAEVECLQCELSERDQQLAELIDGVDGQLESTGNTLTQSESETLVSRLEDLLAELSESDQRIQVLEELLLAEQELVHSQTEEKQQIELWIGDIEQRLTAREAEWKAEQQVLNDRVAQLKSERDDADQRIQASQTTSDHEADVQNDTVQQIRADLDQARDEIENARRRNVELEAELQRARDLASDESKQEFVEKAVRDERLALAQERAALSRERAELARQVKQSVDSDLVPSHDNEADARFYAFRQTLKQLHKEDQTDLAHCPKPTLGQRITDLWRRLDGPTDTD